MPRRNLCTHLITALILATLALISQQTQATLDHLWDTCRSVCVAQTATADGRVRVTITKQKPKLHLPKPQRPVIRLSVDDDNSEYYDELPELQIGYRRPELVDQTAEVHDDILDEIKIRLLLARKRALEAYHTNWG